jgi:hypothetical protein
MDPLLLGALTTGLQTGLSPAQNVDISSFYGQGSDPEAQRLRQQQQNNILYIAIFAALIVSAGTIYFITQQK